MQKGFSLVELSIVLVILGLLTGGILTGQSLIRASELRSITTQHQQIVAAARAFRDKYFALPGDMTNATSFWGAATCPGTLGSTTITVTTCNGDGDGLIDWGSSSATTSYENFRMWQQLANAGLLEGSYSGLPASGGERGATVGVNCPRGKISNAGFSLEPINIIPAGDTWRWQGTYGNLLYYGTSSSGMHPMESPILRPEELWNIDTKLDDGKPAYGSVRSHRQIGAWTNCTTTNVEATTEYKLSDTSVSCAALFPNSF